MYICISYCYTKNLLLIGYRKHIIDLKYVFLNEFSFIMACCAWHAWMVCFLVVLKYSPWGRDHRMILDMLYDIFKGCLGVNCLGYDEGQMIFLLFYFLFEI